MSNTAEIDLVRLLYNTESTRGIVTTNGVFLGYSLEDVVRPAGSAKVPGETAIPAGRYEVIVTYSTRFKRKMTLLVGVVNFDGVRMHGGNTAVDSKGCLLIAKNAIAPNIIQGSLEKEMTAFVKSEIAKGKKVFITITDTRKAAA